MIFNFDALNTSRFYEDDFPLLMPRWGYVASAFVLFIIGFFGFFLNLMVILLMFKDRQLWTPLNIILFNLVCSDFSVSVLGNPFTLISALFHRWVFGPTMCMLYGFLMALFGITSITTLTVISFERYLMVTRPLSARHLSRGGAGLSILFIWTYSLALTTPPLMGWGNYVSEAANISCSVNWHEQSMNTLTYILFLFAMGQIVPFAVITFSYVNIIRTLKQNSKRLGRVNRAEARATAMVFIMIVAFTVAWTPYSVFALMEQFATEGIISPGAGVIPALVAKSSICYDPLIYVGMNTQFRQSIKRIFGIHSKHGNSRLATKHVTSSPAHRMTSTNDLTINLNSSEYQPISKKRDHKIYINDDISEVNIEQDQLAAKNFGLSTIPENKTTSDAERSENTIYDEDSSSHKKSSVADECFKPTNDDHSPILTLLDTERTVFTKMGTKPVEDSNVVMNIYGNQAYEGHLTDLVELNAKYEHHKTKQPNIKHSYSLDLHQLSKDQSNNKKRKLSIEPKMDSFSPPKGLFKDNVIGKMFDHSSKGARDNFKSYICGHDSEDDSIL